MFPMIGLEEKFMSLLKRTLNLISSDVMFSIVNEVSDWNVEFAVKIGKMCMEETSTCCQNALGYILLIVLNLLNFVPRTKYIINI